MLCPLLCDPSVKGQDGGREPVTGPGHCWTGISFLKKKLIHQKDNLILNLSLSCGDTKTTIINTSTRSMCNRNDLSQPSNTNVLHMEYTAYDPGEY